VALLARGVRFHAAVVIGLTRIADPVFMSSLTDKATSPPAGGDLAARFSAPLLSYFLRRVRDRAEAEDLVQDALVRVIRACECEVIEHPESYVFTVAANLLKDSRRYAVRHPTVACVAVDEDTGGEVEETLVDERSPERVLDGETSLAQVLRALNELSELTRNVFILFRLEHMKQKDIAALYGIGQSTVEKHVMRAVLHLARRCVQS
jgi:RNA polymerase sigma factor (sigma-70 family)